MKIVKWDKFMIGYLEKNPDFAKVLNTGLPAYRLDDGRLMRGVIIKLPEIKLGKMFGGGI